MHCGLPPRASADDLVAQVLGHLGRTGDWLLIFDNAEAPADLTGWLPTHPAGHALITSRNPYWAGTAVPVSVNVFDRPDSVTVLRRHRPDLTDQQAEQKNFGTPDEVRTFTNGVVDLVSIGGSEIGRRNAAQPSSTRPVTPRGRK